MSASKNDICQGLHRSIPICFGYFPIGFAFGVMAVGVDMTFLETALMSTLVYAGSAQFIAVGMVGEQIAVLTIALTTFLVNLRHLLMSAALATRLGHLTRLQQAVFAYQLTDESFALHSVDFKEEEKPPVARIIATNMTAHLCWVAGSIAGAWTGGLLTNLEAMGLDFALPAMFIFLLIIQLASLKYILVALLAMVLSLFLFNFLGGHWYVIITTLIAATAGLFLDKIKNIAFLKGRT